MTDVHIHFLHGYGGGYTLDFFEGFISKALEKNLNEIYLLEHTHQFTEFKEMYDAIVEYNEYQSNWIKNRMNGSIENYLSFIETVKEREYPLKVKFGLEVCYIPETKDILKDILKEYSFDFLTGSVHWINGWGFDHPKQKELWYKVDVNDIYTKYYEIMCELCESGLFTGLAHPDNIKCFGFFPTIDMTIMYSRLANSLNRNRMYAENSGGLRLNYDSSIELGLNRKLLDIFKENNITILTASDAHKQSDVGANIQELELMLKK